MYQTPDYLSRSEIAQLNAQIHALNQQRLLAMQSNRDSFLDWIKNSVGWLWNRIKELGKVKTGLGIIASLLGFDVDWD